MPSRSIRLFLVDGSPTGLRTAEIGLSTCKALACPRASLASLKDRSEAKRTGVYVLVGEEHPDHPGRTAVYVGEGDDVMSRLARHENTKDFWDRVVFFVSKDENLTKAHVRHLEARLVALAREANRAIVLNGNDPEGGRLPEADEAEMAQFLEQIRILLGIFGISEFEPVKARAGRAATGASATAGASDHGPVFFFSVGGVEAQGVVDEAGFIVRKGSRARKTGKSAVLSYKQADREELLGSGVLKEEKNDLRFTQDYLFTSPSAAASVISGTSQNGRIVWKLSDGTTLKAWEERELAGK